MSAHRQHVPRQPGAAAVPARARVVRVAAGQALCGGENESCHPQARICLQCGVRHLSLFGVLPVQALHDIRVHIDTQRLKDGTVFFGEGQAGDFVYTLRSGLARLERSTAQGVRRILRIYGRGDVLGLESLLGRPHGATAVALGEVELCRIPTALVHELSAQYPPLTVDLMQRWQRALDEADEWLSDLSVGSARYRALCLLRKLTRYFDAGIVVLPARGDIGAMLNVTLETASRLISDFRREGVLEGEGPRWFRVDAERLAAAIERAIASG